MANLGGSLKKKSVNKSQYLTSAKKGSTRNMQLNVEENIVYSSQELKSAEAKSKTSTRASAAKGYKMSAGPSEVMMTTTVGSAGKGEEIIGSKEYITSTTFTKTTTSKKGKKTIVEP